MISLAFLYGCYYAIVPLVLVQWIISHRTRGKKFTPIVVRPRLWWLAVALLVLMLDAVITFRTVQPKWATRMCVSDVALITVPTALIWIQKQFTLIELLVITWVVALLGVLSLESVTTSGLR